MPYVYMGSTVYDEVTYIPGQIQMFRENTFVDDTDFGTLTDFAELINNSL